MSDQIRDRWVDGLNAMAVYCLSAVELVKSGQWTLERMESWLLTCQSNDPEFLKGEIEEVKAKAIERG